MSAVHDTCRRSPLLPAMARPRVRELGQGLAEYALILALIAIVAIVALLFLGGQISSIINEISTNI
jgi:Flp pilus assembly pilin Flp